MAQEAPPPPFRKRSTKSVRELDWDPRKYTEGGKESRDDKIRRERLEYLEWSSLGLTNIKN